MIIGERLKEARIDKKLTQEDLGNMLGVSKVSICGYETGVRTPNMQNFLDLIRILDLDVKYVLGQDIEALNEKGETYGVKVATSDMEILDAIKENRELYNMFCKNPQKTVQKIKSNLKI